MLRTAGTAMFSYFNFFSNGTELTLDCPSLNGISRTSKVKSSKQLRHYQEQTLSTGCYIATLNILVRSYHPWSRHNVMLHTILKLICLGLASCLSWIATEMLLNFFMFIYSPGATKRMDLIQTEVGQGDMNSSFNFLCSVSVADHLPFIAILR